MEGDDGPVLFLGEWGEYEIGIQAVHPALTALLAVPARQQHSAFRPVIWPVVADELPDDRILGR